MNVYDLAYWEKDIDGFSTVHEIGEGGLTYPEILILQGGWNLDYLYLLAFEYEGFE